MFQALSKGLETCLIFAVCSNVEVMLKVLKVMCKIIFTVTQCIYFHSTFSFLDEVNNLVLQELSKRLKKKPVVTEDFELLEHPTDSYDAVCHCRRLQVRSPAARPPQWIRRYPEVQELRFRSQLSHTTGLTICWAQHG